MSVFVSKTIEQSQNTGDTIRSLREEAGLSREELAHASSVDEKYIAAFEEFRYQDIPGSMYGKNYLRAIARVFGISEQSLLQRFEKELERFPFKHIIDPPKAIDKRVLFTPRKVRWMLVVMLILVGIGYLIFEVGGIIKPPELQIFAPQDNIEVTEPYVLISGKTQEGAQVQVNTAAIDVDQQGFFSAEIDLSPGVNMMTITAIGKFGRQTQVVRNIFADL